MIELKHKWLRALMVLLVLTATFSSCKKDDNSNDQNADYVGKWSSDVITSDTQGDYKDNLTLTKNTFEDIIQTKVTSGAWVNSIIVKGTMTVTNNIMNVHVSEIGISAIDDQSGEFTGEITTYKEGSLLYGVIMDQVDQDSDFQSEYSINNNKLTLKTDVNNDGDFSDANETTTYTRQ
jgi:hypothetical protein